MEIRYTTGSQESLYNISVMCEDAKIVVMVGLGLAVVIKDIANPIRKANDKMFWVMNDRTTCISLKGQRACPKRYFSEF